MTTPAPPPTRAALILRMAELCATFDLFVFDPGSEPELHDAQAGWEQIRGAVAEEIARIREEQTP